MQNQSKNKKKRQEQTGTPEQANETRRSDEDARTEQCINTPTNYTGKTQWKTGEHKKIEGNQ